jgi:hypothetical protein
MDVAKLWRAGGPYVLGVAIYFSSRLVVFLAIEFAAVYLPLRTNGLLQPGDRWYDHLLRWDSGWYIGIATQGYHYNGDPNDQQAVAFFPLYPLISRFVALVAGISPAHALLLVANLAAVLAVLLLTKLVRREHGDEVALLAVAFLSFYPGSLFLSAGYTEALALLLILSCFALLNDRRYVLAAAVAGLAVATRSVGIVLTPVLLWELWLRFGADRRQFAWRAVACIVLATSGLWIYMIYLGIAFGHPLAFADAQAAWHGNVSLGSRLVAALTLQPLLRLHVADFSPAGLDLWFLLLFLLLTALAWKRLSSLLGLFMLGVLMLPYLSLSGGPVGPPSMMRFCLLAFPAFIVLAVECRRALWLGAIIIGLFAALLALDSALFAQWYWVA